MYMYISMVIHFLCCSCVLFLESMHNMPGKIIMNLKVSVGFFIIINSYLFIMPSVGQMGNYQEYLKRMSTPLRELESAPVRQHMFGNPFKIDKRMIIDEADIDLMGQGGKTPKKEPNIVNNPVGQIPVQQMQMSPGGVPTIPKVLKRKAGPLPKDFRFTPYKNRRMHRGMDEDSNSDGYLSSAPSSPLGSISSPESPMSFDLVREKETSMDHNSLSEYISKDSRVLEEDDSKLIIAESPPHDVPSISISFGSLYNIDLEMNDVGNNAEKDDKYTPDENYSCGYAMNGGNNDDVKINPLPPDNGLSLPVVNHINNFSSTNHVGLGNNKIKKASKVVKASVPSASIESPSPQGPTDDEHTRAKNKKIREDLQKEIHRPRLRKLPYVPTIIVSYCFAVTVLIRVLFL